MNFLPLLLVISSFDAASEVKGRDALVDIGTEFDFVFFVFVLEDERGDTEEQDETSEAQIPESESESTLTQELKLEVELATEYLRVPFLSESKAREDRLEPLLFLPCR